MNDEVEEMVKEPGAKPPKRKMGKKEKIAIIATVLIIAILIGAYVAMIFMAPPEKYWKPEKEFKMPAVDWSTMKSSYVVERTTYDQDGAQGPLINQTIGSEKSDGNFRVEIVVDICCYIYTPHNFDSIRTGFYVSFTKLGGDYIVKNLIFKYDPSDSDVRTSSFNYNSFTSKNLYFTADTGLYSTPYHAVNCKFDYEWWTLHQIRGINKDAVDIKSGGFSSIFDIYLYDEYPEWYNHTVMFTATLYYGHHTLFGWQDVHELSTSVVIYIVPEGGE